jgi:hypothetical protein
VATPAGQQLVKVDNQFKVMCVALQPCDEHVFLCGGYSPVVKAWDARVSKVTLFTPSLLLCCTGLDLLW